MKKYIKWIVLALLLAAVLTGCGLFEAEEEETSKAEAAAETQSETTQEETEDPYEGLVINPLTGIRDYPEESEGNRPVAVTVNNLAASLPQYGTAQADIIFEIPVEGYLTRLVCIYADYTDVPYIVSVRSYRYYFPVIALGFDAIYIHWGQDESMMDYYNSLDMDSYNGLYNTYLFGRDSARLSSGYALEHTSYFDGTLLPEQMESDGVRTTLAEGYEGTVFNFNSGDDVISYGDESALTVDISFGGNTAKLVYDEESKTYLKYTAGVEQTDGSTGEQLSFTNVIILETSMYVRDEAKHLSIALTGITNGAGCYISGGTAQPITWAKADEYSQFVFYDADGNELEMNCGKTYIAITRSGTYSFE